MNPLKFFETSPYTVYTVLLAVLYVTYIRFTRYSYIKTIHKNYSERHGLSKSPPLTRRRGSSSKAPTRAEYPMTPAEAQTILQTSAELEMPFTTQKALEFALFLTYGIETISEVLLSSSEFIDPEKSGRRYADTGLLIGSFLRYPLVGPGSGVETTSSDEPLDPRSSVAIARMNQQHSHYKAITNNDLLYTLSTFIREPASWARQFEWRPLSPLEEMAWFVFFSEIGRRMGIEEIPRELQELLDWSEAYEAENMLPNEKSKQVAEATTDLLLFNIPPLRPLRNFAVLAVSALMSDRLRASVMAPEPSPFVKKLVHSGVHFRAFLIRNFFPPRPRSLAVSALPDPRQYPAFPPGYKRGSETEKKSDSKEDRYAPMSHPQFSNNMPYYMSIPSKPSLWFSKCLAAIGLLNPRAIPGPSKYKPEGYRLETMGPAKWEGKELDQVRERAEKIHGGKLEGPYAVGGVPRSRCPFAA